LLNKLLPNDNSIIMLTARCKLVFSTSIIPNKLLNFLKLTLDELYKGFKSLIQFSFILTIQRQSIHSFPIYG